MRTATPTDIQPVRTLLGRAFATDPLLSWMFPAPSTRPDAIAAYCGLFAEGYLRLPRSRVAEVDGAVVGAALWRWPEEDISAPEVLPDPWALFVALVGAEHARVTGDGFSAVGPARPEGPHAYLHFLAVDADHRGQGHARRLVEEGLARAADDGLPALLETTNPGNVPRYEHLGFTVHAEIVLGSSGPRMWVMTATTR